MQLMVLLEPFLRFLQPLDHLFALLKLLAPPLDLQIFGLFEQLPLALFSIQVSGHMPLCFFEVTDTLFQLIDAVLKLLNLRFVALALTLDLRSEFTLALGIHVF